MLIFDIVYTLAVKGINYPYHKTPISRTCLWVLFAPTHHL